ncbi:MAG: glycosyltransferase family 39 protein [Gemmatimonadota bacterium]
MRSPLPKRNRLIAIGAAIFLLAALTLRVQYILHSQVAVDEFEHVHAAWLVSLGQRPYVDFFEHHPPFFYLAAALPLRLLEPGFDALIQLRFAALGAFVATGVLVGLLVRRTATREAVLAAAVFLLANTLLFQVGMRLYLDTFAAPFVVLAALMLARERTRLSDVYVATIALGIAGLITQKTAMALPAYAILLIAKLRRDPATNHRPWKAVLGGAVAGAATCAGILVLTLGADGLAAFWRDAIALNAGWRARRFPWPELYHVVRHDGFYFLLALGGVAMLGTDLVRRRSPLHRTTPMLFLVSLALGIVLLPVVWEEYFVLLLPFLCAVAGIALARAVHAIEQRHAYGLLIPIALAFLVGASGWRLTFSSAHFPAWAALMIMCAWLALALHAFMRWRRRSAPGWMWLSLPAIAYALVLQTEETDASRNDAQRERVDFVMRTTKPNEPYFDGYSGYGVFRPHAYRYWLLHDEMQLMLGGEELQRGVLAALRQTRPPLVAADAWTATLPSAVQTYLRETYAPSRYAEIWQRRSATSAPDRH